jgi:urease accessory protein
VTASGAGALRSLPGAAAPPGTSPGPAPALGPPRRRPQLAVTFAVDPRGHTFVGAQRATHPFHLCRPFYRPDDPEGLCTLYVQGCAGGLFEGDRAALTLVAEPGGRAHLTTGAATLVHRMACGGRAEQSVELEARAGALLEYFPEPTILFSGCRLSARLRIRLGAGARVIAAEGFLSHRLPDDVRPFEALQAETRIEDLTGRLSAREHFIVGGGEWEAGGLGRMGRYACLGSLFVLGGGTAPLAPLRAVLAALPDAYAGASALPDGAGVVARVLAADGHTLRSCLTAAWAAARGALDLPPGRVRPK